ncbi:cysteine proteinase inhibitor 5-like [Oryza brachyantha]|uniref:Cysteine proteinase inhibitor n=1 Tax=Oryza brachyantha TaxID=4533 RepID=J3L732_ORYBR|nr:cysteine proteinase inhibitor 5-like [Oryza brachyantha]
MASKLYAVAVAVLLSSARLAAAGADDEQWPAAGRGRKVGGTTAVEDVEGNREVQELGLFCVVEHNRRGSPTARGHRLVFSRVVAAQTQVVAGIKYYLRIAARNGLREGDDDEEKVFDAVVVVKAWVPSREMLSFAPAAEQPGY